MTKYVKCGICNQWHWTDENCKPEYQVYFEEYLGDEPKTFRANSHEDAATEFAEYYDINNEQILIGNEIEIKVEKDGIIKHFRISAEPAVHYTSTEVIK